MCGAFFRIALISDCDQLVDVDFFVTLSTPGVEEEPNGQYGAKLEDNAPVPDIEAEREVRRELWITAMSVSQCTAPT